MKHPRPIHALAILAAATLLAGAGCAGNPRPGSPGGPPLEYGIPDPNRAVYTFADTTRFEITAGSMGAMNVVSAHAGTAEVTFRPGPAGLEALVRLPVYSGRFENPNQAAAAADQSDITGAWEVRLEPTGALEVAAEPAMTERGREVAGGQSLIRPLFVSLPALSVAPGATWVDTVTVTERTEGTVSRARSVVTSTLAGDTVVAGERVLRIETSSRTRVEVEGTSGGIEIRQTMTGSLQGWVLWDPERAILVERKEAGALTGTLELPGMGVAGLPVEAAVRRMISLRP